ncbi:MAG: DM13 domain-containing protein [Anaerolineales bacterium]
MLKNPTARLTVLAVTLLGSAATWYLISPLFIQAMHYGGFPTLSMMATRTPRPATATPSSEPPTPTSAVSLLVEGSSALLLSESEFYSIAHQGRGRANLYLTESGALVVRLVDFQVEDGPDLHVYLTSEDPVLDREGEELQNSLDLGELKALLGDQVYEIPEGTDIESYNSVVIWCVPYLVPFAAAQIGD